ncbi:MAG: hypothetical protein JWN76_2959 [Chitinophagaceae bacterium]|nr:hypothetical protein [Chitinophagaceae bacterium]
MTDDRLQGKSQITDSDREETESEKIIHRHIDNEHDEITEEDINNVKIESSEAAADSRNEEHDSLSTTNEKLDNELDELDRQAKKNHQKGQSTPWDVVD